MRGGKGSMMVHENSMLIKIQYLTKNIPIICEK